VILFFGLLAAQIAPLGKAAVPVFRPALKIRPRQPCLPCGIIADYQEPKVPFKTVKSLIRGKPRRFQQALARRPLI
jgi:hypothetical protein